MRRLLFLLVFLAAACNFKPMYQRPDVPVCGEWRYQPENHAEYANVDWWKQFHDPYLDALIAKALQNNQDLQRATSRILEFYARYREVFSQFFPELDATAGIDRIKLSEDINFQPLIPTVPRINYLYELLLRISYEFDFWGRIRNSTEAARAGYLAAIEAQRNVIVTLVSSVAAAYFQLMQYDTQLAIAKKTYGSRKGYYEIATKRFDAGLVSQLEVKQAESEMEAAEVQIKNFEALVPQQENLISILLGDAPTCIERSSDIALYQLPPEVPAGLPSDLLENRPDIRQAEQELLAANAQIGIAKAAFFPTITFTGADGKRSTSFHDFFDSSATFFDFGLRAVEPLFTGWRLTFQVKEAYARFEALAHAYFQTVLTAMKEVEDALVQHEKAKEKLVVQKRQEDALAEYLRLSILRYENGQNDYLTVLDAENSLFFVQLSQASTQADVFVSLIQLYKALGQGWKTSEAAESDCAAAAEAEEEKDEAPNQGEVVAAPPSAAESRHDPSALP